MIFHTKKNKEVKMQLLENKQMVSKKINVVKSNELTDSCYDLNLIESRVLEVCIGMINTMPNNADTIIIKDAMSKLGLTFDVYNKADQVTKAQVRRELDITPKITDETAFRFSEKDYADLFNVNINGAYRALRRVSESFRSNIFTKLNPEPGVSKERFSFIHKIQYHDIDIKNEHRAISLFFHRDLIPYLTQISRNYTKYSLKSASTFQSEHTFRIFTLLSQFKDIGTTTIELVELKRMMKLEDKYTRFTNFREKIIDRAVNEINAKDENGNKLTNLTVKYGLLRVKKKVVKIRFNIFDHNKAEDAKTALEHNIKNKKSAFKKKSNLKKKSEDIAFEKQQAATQRGIDEALKILDPRYKTQK